MEEVACRFWTLKTADGKGCAAGRIREMSGDKNYTQRICQTPAHKDCPHFAFRNEQKERGLKNVAEKVA